MLQPQPGIGRIGAPPRSCVTALLIDARNAQVAAWYASYGALPLLDAPLTLLLALDVVAAALRAAGKLNNPVTPGATHAGQGAAGEALGHGASGDAGGGVCAGLRRRGVDFLSQIGL